MKNLGQSSKLVYDKCFYPERINESVAPGEYRLQEYQIYNDKSCLSTLGPRPGLMGDGVSSVVARGPAMAQRLVDVDSELSNRNLPQSRCRKGRVNTMNVNSVKQNDLPVCNGDLVPEYSRYTVSARQFRDAQINRFVDLDRDVTKPIFWNFSVNTTLEAKDNYVPVGPRILTQMAAYPRTE